jgi:hypothetical protein
VVFIPGAARQLRVDPLTTSGVMITLLVVSGVLFAWLYFIEPAAPAARDAFAWHGDDPSVWPVGPHAGR